MKICKKYILWTCLRVSLNKWTLETGSIIITGLSYSFWILVAREQLFLCNPYRDFCYLTRNYDFGLQKSNELYDIFFILEACASWIGKFHYYFAVVSFFLYMITSLCQNRIKCDFLLRRCVANTGKLVLVEFSVQISFFFSSDMHKLARWWWLLYIFFSDYDIKIVHINLTR